MCVPGLRETKPVLIDREVQTGIHDLHMREVSHGKYGQAGSVGGQSEAGTNAMAKLLEDLAQELD